MIVSKEVFKLKPFLKDVPMIENIIRSTSLNVDCLDLRVANCLRKALNRIRTVIEKILNKPKNVRMYPSKLNMKLKIKNK
jgi:hypothetical protein